MVNNPNDATIDIPLSGVTSQTGARRVGTSKSTAIQQPTYNEKQSSEKPGFYHRHVASGHRKTAARKTGHNGRDGEEDALTHMGVIYNRILNFSIVTRYFLYILPVAILISIPIIIGATAAPGANIGGVRIVWFFAWCLTVWVSLWVSKLVARFLPSIFQFLCGIVSSGTRKYAMVLKSLEIYLALAGWALTALATFVPVMTRNPTQSAQKATYNQDHDSSNSTLKGIALQYQYATTTKPWQSIVQSILTALLVCSLILLAEKLLVQLISISYHRTQFTAKIHESKHKIWLLSLLYDASRSLFPAYCPEFAEEDYIINDSLELSENATRQGRPGSANPVRLLQDVGRFGDKMTSAFGNLASEISGKQVFNPNSAHSIVVEALEKNRSSEALAKRLWMSFVVEGKEALYLEDIVEVLGADRHAEAEEAFASLDRDGNGDISLDEMIMTVCEFGKDRHSIANSLHDVDQAINVLDKLLCLIIFVICIFVFVGFLNSSFTTTLATAGTALLSLSFVFAGTAQEVLSSCIFLFVKHPFDVLDRVDIGTDQLVVKHISLLFTVFKYVNNQKLTQVPNTVLNTMWIQNVSRSEAMREQLLLYISFDTTLEDVQLLKNEMQAFVNDKENSRDFQPDIDVEITGIAEMNKLELKVEIRHKSNWSNETIRAARRSKFMCALVLALRKIPINAPGGGNAALGSADQPTYSVSVSDSEAVARRTDFKKTQDAKRLFPTMKEDLPADKTPGGISTSMDAINPRDSATPPPLRYRQVAPSESTALNTLNSRHPAADTARSPTDIVEPTSPKSLARSVSGMTEVHDLDRTVSIEDVRGMLRRQSTRGKRKSPKASTYASRFPLTSDASTRPLPPPSARVDYASPPSLSSRADPGSLSSTIDFTESPKFEYDPYAQSPEPYQPPPISKETSPTQPSRFQPYSQSQPLSPLPEQQQQQQQRPPPPQSTTTPRQNQTPTFPTPPQSYQPALPGKSSPSQPKPAQPSLIPSSDPASKRSDSPIRNPFQLNALKTQAQGVGVPRAVQKPPSEAGQLQSQRGRSDSNAQMRRPVPSPGSGNAFAREQAQQAQGGEGVMQPPPRGDSLTLR